MATIANVARKAGVSASTARHVLNGMRRVATELARSLNAASIQPIGIAVPPAHSTHLDAAIVERKTCGGPR